jgi:hypothetical protein
MAKNTDYSASAVNLSNHANVKSQLDIYLKHLADVERLRIALEALPEYKALEEAGKTLSSERKLVELSIEANGSYQDLANGHYAVKQRSASKSYNPEAFKKAYPQFAPAVIIEAVDTAKLTGLIKGGLLAEDALKIEGIIHESESFTYIIK